MAALRTSSPSLLRFPILQLFMAIIRHSPVTVKYILLDCTCQRYLRVDILKELFENVDSRNIFAFIKDINFYHHIKRFLNINFRVLILAIFFYHIHIN